MNSSTGMSCLKNHLILYSVNSIHFRGGYKPPNPPATGLCRCASIIETVQEVFYLLVFVYHIVTKALF